MRTAAEIIKQRYPFYDEDIAQKDIELSGEEVQYMMKQYAKEALTEAYDEICRLDWGIMDNHVDGKECLKAIQSLLNELK